ALLAVGMISPAFTRTYASTASRTEYSDVLSDLRKDSAFNVADYPQNPKDYSVKVIQVAESVNGELFVYIYQPNAGVNVTSMNMATKYSDLHAGDIKNYKLRLLNISGALAKYAVKNFKIGAENIRYYNIISAFREWIDGVDSVSGNENDISEVSYEVAKCYVVETEKGQIAYSCFETETIMITDKYVGYIRYPNGHYLFASYSSLDSFYVAFNTDKRMDKLMEADVSFVYLKESRNYFLWWEVRHDINATGEMEVSLTADDVGISEKLDEFPYYGGNTYSWKRIETAQSFLANEDLTDEAKSNLRNKQWVLRFAEFDYKSFYNLASMELNTAVEQVTILRLKFETDGKVYNLGVVDNKQAPAPDQEPDNKQENTGSNHFGNILKKFGEWLKDLFSRLFHGDLKWWEWVVFAVIVIVVLVIISILVRILKFIVEPFRRKKKDNKE
ncbi:MAG: hypothetical protein K2J30_04495, partial [Clostridia bacterium]|nr:hypothetical protein [Clostridia bacterium]